MLPAVSLSISPPPHALTNYVYLDYVFFVYFLFFNPVVISSEQCHYIV